MPARARDRDVRRDHVRRNPLGDSTRGLRHHRHGRTGRRRNGYARAARRRRDHRGANRGDRRGAVHRSHNHRCVRGRDRPRIRRPPLARRLHASGPSGRGNPTGPGCDDSDRGQLRALPVPAPGSHADRARHRLHRDPPPLRLDRRARIRHGPRGHPPGRQRRAAARAQRAPQQCRRRREPAADGIRAGRDVPDRPGLGRRAGRGGVLDGPDLHAGTVRRHRRAPGPGRRGRRIRTAVFDAHARRDVRDGRSGRGGDRCRGGRGRPPPDLPSEGDGTRELGCRRPCTRTDRRRPGAWCGRDRGRVPVHRFEYGPLVATGPVGGRRRTRGAPGSARRSRAAHPDRRRAACPIRARHRSGRCGDRGPLGG